VYNAIRQNAALWESTALLVVYDEHGGIYDHVPHRRARLTDSWRSPMRPAPASRSCSNRLGVRVRRVLDLAVDRPRYGSRTGRVFEHASIPGDGHRFLPAAVSGSFAAREGGGDVSRSADAQTPCAPTRPNSTSADPWL